MYKGKKFIAFKLEISMPNKNMTTTMIPKEKKMYYLSDGQVYDESRLMTEKEAAAAIEEARVSGKTWTWTTTKPSARKVNSNPWGHILDMKGCTYHYHEGQSALTIKPPQGETLNGDPFKIGLNIGRKIGGCCEMYDAIKFALKTHAMHLKKKDGMEFPSQLVNALQKAIDDVDQS